MTRRKLHESKKSDLENLKLILEIRAKRWEIGGRKLIAIILPILITIATLVAGYIFDRERQRDADETIRRQRRMEFLSDLLLNTESKREIKIYAIKELARDFLLEAKDILYIASEEVVDFEVRRLAGENFKNSIDSLLLSHKIDSTSFFEQFGEASILDTIARETAIMDSDRESWWLYLGN